MCKCRGPGRKDTCEIGRAGQVMSDTVPTPGASTVTSVGESGARPLRQRPGPAAGGGAGLQRRRGPPLPGGSDRRLAAGTWARELLLLWIDSGRHGPPPARAGRPVAERADSAPPNLGPTSVAVQAAQ